MSNHKPNSGTSKGRPTGGRRDRNAARAAGLRKQRRLRWALVAVGAAIVIGVAALAANSSDSGGPGATEPAAFDLPRLNGDGRIRLADYRGKPVVVNFFASWCTACDAELPGFARVSTELKDQVTFVGVNALETGDRLLMPRRHHITWWPLARDIGGAQGSGLHDALGGGSSMPLTAFYAADGKLLAVERAALPEEALRAEIRQLFGTEVQSSGAA
ncbi:MAG: redoxin domain-containing protein [Actinobacteria bacterium]|nr:redoxin domain-containing protein [Actinomycetota bacterium]